jgi:hypothetical protein
VVSITNDSFKNILIELCIGNYIKSNGLVNDIDGTSQDYTKTPSKLVIWINFHNLQIRINMKIKYSHTYIERERENSLCLTKKRYQLNEIL